MWDQVLAGANKKVMAFWDIAPYLSHRPDDGGTAHLWYVGLLQREYTAQFPRRLSFTLRQILFHYEAGIAQAV
jgi:hypothetical protein